MSLPVLVVIVVFGIALSVAAVHFTGGSRKARLADAEQARERFAEDFPDEPAAAIHLTSDGRTAFLELGRGRLGIVHAIGDRFLTRIVTPRDVLARSDDGAGTIALRLADFTWKGGHFTFANAADAHAVLRVLQPQHPSSTKEAA
ncbi:MULTISPECIES: type II secretion system protein [unclassified Mesorhizobium]|uniref:type II secretion system protein n=1 Tax=unclassified Mesorhizobium TaxID=325217 RepID=UPI00112BEE71|nr:MULTISPECIES: type II secretion system protein [unclassified Mesorhizobium]MCA0057625.1 type II secretion system GspH family protein [Mesorhizobium sp. B261B1A]TPJ52656.1 type II secretion system protein [Mesorhizobium sp. B2-6-4]TPL08626.1 type II secretion system protein [Mesorhizobium sp. B2-4-11]TPM03020.1 type II secretion system protein [Mesorhizobium sp. B2-3-8]TPM16983.1 type II secretion system protein [Mesorhizobium sp. B2-3-7]